MSKIEKTKAMIDMLKSILMTLIITLFGIVGYIFVNSEKLSIIKIFIAIFGVIFIMALIVLATKKILEKINDLENL